jgi:hypothetical protein
MNSIRNSDHTETGDDNTETDNSPIPVKKKLSELSVEERKQYNAKLSKISYEKRKFDISNKRSLHRAADGKRVLQSTIEDENRKWEPIEQRILLKSVENHKTGKHVPYRDETFISENKGSVDAYSDGFYTLLSEDSLSDGHVETLQNSRQKNVSVSNCHNMYEWLISNDYLLVQKNNEQKQLGINSYKSKINAIFDIYGTSNLLDVYVYTERLMNKLNTSHLSAVSIKDYSCMLLSIIKYSFDLPKDSELFGKDLPLLRNIVHETQIDKFRKYIKMGISLSKSIQKTKMNFSSYYKWVDLKKIPHLISTHRDANTLQGLRDQVIANFYINENVMRDNMGSIIVAKNDDIYDYKIGNILNIETNVLYLNDFKTSNVNKFKDFKIHIFQDTMDIVHKYLKEVERVTGTFPKYLITKNDGSHYKNGKLSGYIATMFNKYTGAFDLTINHLRHSVATHHMYSFLEMKIYISYLLHHSYDQHVLYERKSTNTINLPALVSRQDTEDTEDTEDTYIGKRIGILYDEGVKGETVITGNVVKNLGVKSDLTFMYEIEFADKNKPHIQMYLPNKKAIIM